MKTYIRQKKWVTTVELFIYLFFYLFVFDYSSLFTCVKGRTCLIITITTATNDKSYTSLQHFQINFWFLCCLLDWKEILESKSHLPKYKCSFTKKNAVREHFLILASVFSWNLSLNIFWNFRRQLPYHNTWRSRSKLRNLVTNCQTENMMGLSCIQIHVDKSVPLITLCNMSKYLVT